MIRLSRKNVKAPADWPQKVSKALPNVKKFKKAARTFEKQPLAKRKAKVFSEFAGDTLKKKKFPTIWGAAKPQLAAMSNDKCAYCEHPIGSKREGQVEHFKPKSLFPTLAYNWNNYFLACGGCNGAKSDKWPDKGSYLRPDGSKDPSKRLQFQQDGSVNARKADSDTNVTITDFDLNRKPLVRHRRMHVEFGVIQQVNTCIGAFRKNRRSGLKQAKDHLARVRDRKMFYSAALTQCFLRAWNAACPQAKLS
ncbi:MAG: HNH endonuclease [Acidobacteria bacterium]|nr:HNH endonuclease [Acidobacteriota bacterium]